MSRLLFPLIAMFFIVGVAGISLQGYHSSTVRKRNTVTAIMAKAAQLDKDNARKSQQIVQANDDIARGREFLNDWQLAQARSNRGGIENQILEIARTHEVSVPTPRVDAPTSLMTTDTGNVMARQISVQADGNINSLLRFFSDTERAFPLGQVQSLAVKTTDREPKLEFTMALLDRAFSPMPEIPAGAPAPDNTGPFAFRPDMSKPTPFHLPDNLFARNSLRVATPGQVTNSTDIEKMLSGLVITGIVWNDDPEKRLLLSKGFILRVKRPVPSALVKGSAQLVLSVVGRDFATFEVVTEVFNTVTNKVENESVKRDWHYRLYSPITTDG